MKFDLTQLVVNVRKGAGVHDIDVDVVSVYDCPECGAIVREDRRERHTRYHGQHPYMGPIA